MIEKTVLMKIMLLSGLILSMMACERERERSLQERMKQAESSPVKSGSTEFKDPLLDAENTVRVSNEDGSDFYTRTRTQEMKRYPCSSCHESGGTTVSSSTTGNNKRKAHWRIDVRHGENGTMSCSTCHGNESADALQSPDGREVSFDRPDQLCKTCHGKQVRDWKGGAHGKQHKFWQGPSVRYNCTTCHDPHDPAFKKRWPAKGPSFPDRSLEKHK